MRLSFLVFLIALAFHTTVSNAMPFIGAVLDSEAVNHAIDGAGVLAFGAFVAAEARDDHLDNMDDRATGKMVYRSGWRNLRSKGIVPMDYLNSQIGNPTYKLNRHLKRYLDKLSRADKKRKLKAVGGKPEHLPLLDSILSKYERRMALRVP